MDARRLGAALRTLRLRAAWTQTELARRAGVSESMASRIERGHADHVSMASVRAVALALDAWPDDSLRWRGGELDRAINAGHPALHQALARWIGTISGWELLPEVSFSIHGERGIIDALCWHPATRTLLVVELKTELVDISELLGTFDRKMHLALRVATERGWEPVVVSGWMLVADSRTNHRRLAQHRDVLRSVFRDDGRRIDGWLRNPVGRIMVLSFLPKRHETGLGPGLAPRKRVSRRHRAVSNRRQAA